jgi:uncharacterized membrane protein
MWNKWTALALILSAAVFSGVDMARMYPLLPEKVASHFDAAGAPNGWSTKKEFMWAGGGMFAGLALFLCLLPMILRITPASLINLPNKDYWLGPEQEGATRQFITTWMLWFAALVLWFLAIMFHGVLVANLQQPPRLFSMWWLLGGFFAAMGVLLFAIFRRFRRRDVWTDT